LDTSSQATNEEVDYFDEFEEQVEQVKRQEINSNLMSLEEFQENFIGMHDLAACLTGKKWLALPNKFVTQDIAEGSAGIIYKRIKRVSWLHFMIDPSSGWVGEIMLLGGYLKGQHNSYLAEKAEKSEVKPAKGKAKADFQGGDLSADQHAALTGA
tara:strand:+ start:5936 stop:6400 length:465 start_codon:yes stop_codon:yes gene_type:complete